jgi:hypothetical protein
MDIKETNDYDQFICMTTPEREQYIISQALYLGIRWLLTQPEQFREWSNMWDMADLFNKKYPDYKSSAEIDDPDFHEIMNAAKRPPDLYRVK